MDIRPPTIHLPQLCTAAAIGLHLVLAAPVSRADDKVSKESLALLEDAAALLAKHGDKVILQHKAGALLAKLSILENQQGAQGALGRARSIENAFYSTLALGGIAATEIRSDPNTSAKHYREALVRFRNPERWTARHASALGYLIELVPSYPEKESHELLRESKEVFHSWEGADNRKSKALLSLSKATTAIEPETAEGLLYDVALKSNHYWASVEYLATFMAQQSMEKALELSEKHYAARQRRSFRRAVLMELAKTDFPRAFAGIKEMRVPLDQEISAVKLAEFLLDQDREKEARQVIAHIESLETDFNWTQTSLKTLRSKLEGGEVVSRDLAVNPEAIDKFLHDPDREKLQNLTYAERIVFRDAGQIREFISTSLPLVEAIPEMGYPHHGSPRSAALGILAVCSGLIGETPQASEILKRISIPELRVNYLLDSYEAIHPMPAPVTQWPIHFWQHKTILIRDRGQK